jgi:hypothetical protein
LTEWIWPLNWPRPTRVPKFRRKSFKHSNSAGRIATSRFSWRQPTKRHGAWWRSGATPTRSSTPNLRHACEKSRKSW